jgi:branched-chain amino acid transport system permease protein
VSSASTSSAASTVDSTRLSFIVGLVLLGFLGLIPVLSVAFEDPFLLTLFTRIVIMAIAAVSLNLILGYGGMVSFGHAAYIGVGGYTVGILAFHGVNAAWIQWPLAVIISGIVAALIGLLSLRTKGIFFIMITLALSQLVYYLGNGAFAYGGDDGLNIMKRSDFGGLLNLDNRPTFYYLCWVILLATVYFVHRTVNSRFGMVLQGAKSNDRRMATIGFSGASLPAHRFHSGRHDLRPGRRADRHFHGLHQPRR